MPLEGEHRIVSLGAAPQGMTFPAPMLAVKPPLGVGSLGGFGVAGGLDRYLPTGALQGRIAAVADGSVRIVHAWSEHLLEPAIQIATDARAALVVSLAHLPQGGRLDRLLVSLQGMGKPAPPAGMVLTVASESARRTLVEAGAPERLVCLLPPFAGPIAGRSQRRTATRRLLGLSDRDVLLVAPSPMLPDAGHKLAIWVHAILHQLMDNVRLLLPVGAAAAPNVEHFRQTAGYAEEVFMPQEDLDLEGALCAADMAVFFAHRDLGLWHMATAMAQGLPLVITGTPDAAWCTGGMAPGAPARPRLLAREVLRLLDNPAKAMEIGAALGIRAAQQFEPAISGRRLQEIYRGCCSAG